MPSAVPPSNPISALRAHNLSSAPATGRISILVRQHLVGWCQDARPGSGSGYQPEAFHLKSAWGAEGTALLNFCSCPRGLRSRRGAGGHPAPTRFMWRWGAVVCASGQDLAITANWSICSLDPDVQCVAGGNFNLCSMSADDRILRFGRRMACGSDVVNRPAWRAWCSVTVLVGVYRKEILIFRPPHLQSSVFGAELRSFRALSVLGGGVMRRHQWRPYRGGLRGRQRHHDDHIGTAFDARYEPPAEQPIPDLPS